MRKKVGIITVNKVGWKTVRKRWEKYFTADEDFEYNFYHIENYAKLSNYVTTKLDRFKTIWYALAGRAAVKAALADGCEIILINTFNYIPLLPIKKGVSYFVYGDATAAQVAALQPRTYNKVSAGGHLPPSIDKLYRFGVKRLTKAGCRFIGMSRWYLDGIKEEYQVPSEQLVCLPFGIDIEYWKPDENQRQNGDSLNILFVGAPFTMKGGPILQELSDMRQFDNCRWHFVSYDAEFTSDEKRKYYTNITADTPQLLDIYRKCDVMILPTAADCSPNVAIEASAMGLAVIITDIGATSEIVKDDVNGLLVPPPPKKEDIADKLLRYIKEPQLLRAHREAARKIATEEFDINTHLKNLKSLIKQNA